MSTGEAAVAEDPQNAFARVFRGMRYAKQGRIPEALQEADLAVRDDGGPLITSFGANVYALAGRGNEALAALRAIEKLRVEHYSCAYEVGTGYVLLGQTDAGFRWMENAYDGRSECMIPLKVDPRLDSVRSDPRYQSLLRRVGLADYGAGEFTVDNDSADFFAAFVRARVSSGRSFPTETSTNS